MKKLLVIILSLGFMLHATAQRFGHFGGHFGGHFYGGGFFAPRIGIGIGAYPYPGYYPYYYGDAPYYDYSPAPAPVQQQSDSTQVSTPVVPSSGSNYDPHSDVRNLDFKIADINNDYSEKIWEAKHNANLSRTQRKLLVRQLEHDRDTAIINAERNFYGNRN